jgi:predicted ABC-type ATPase
VNVDRRPVLVLIAGPNGAGKTSLTQDLLYHKWVNEEGCLYINPDNIAQEQYGGWNSREAILAAANEAQRLREECLTNGTSLVFESVMSAPDKIDYLRRAKEAGYFIRLFFVATDTPEICASRVAKRVMEGGHTVPIEKIVSRWTKSIVNCAVAGQFVDRLYVYDNSIDSEKATRQFRAVEGWIEKTYASELNLWAKEIFISLKRA